MTLKNNTRRNFLRGVAGIAGVTALAACTVTKNGTTTTITLNTAEIMDYGDAVLSFANTAIGISFVASGLGASGVAIATAAITELKAGLAAFNTAAGGKATVEYDNASVKTAFDSIVAAVKKINGYIVATITATVANSDVVNNAKIAANAAAGLIGIIQGLVDTYATPKRVGASLKADAYIAEIKTWSASLTR